LRSATESRRSGIGESFFAQPLAAKVPEITFLFWVVKILTTAGGEATSDYLALGSKVTGAAIETLFLVVALVWQFRTRRYVAAAYWFLAYAIATFGTGVSDTMHLVIGVPYAGTTAFWAVVLALVFWLWYRSEGTLSIHSITTRRRSAFTGPRCSPPLRSAPPWATSPPPPWGLGTWRQGSCSASLS